MSVFGYGNFDILGKSEDVPTKEELLKQKNTKV